MLSTSIAIINQTGPYSGNTAKESLDFALVAGSFEQDVALFFSQDGIYQLLKGQNASLAAQKDFSKTFAALEFYDIEKVYACEQSLQQRGLTPEQLCIKVAVLSSEQWQQQLRNYAHILVF